MKPIVSTAVRSHITASRATYSLYGVSVRSELPLPCDKTDQEHVDVELYQYTDGQLSDRCDGVVKSFEDDGFWQCHIFEDDATHIRWKDHFEFLISGDGKQVWWRKLRDVPDEVFFTYFLGQVLSFCLLNRGVEPLHATAVVVNGSAIAFLGDSGQGKSTLAATFLGAGFPLLTDDVLVLEFRGDTVLAHPSQPKIKLCPDTADALLQGRRAIPMNTFTSKMVFSLEPGQHVGEVVRLRSIYVLPEDASSSDISIRRLSGRASFLPLVKNTFNTRVLNSLRLQQQFDFAGRLVSRVPIKQLLYPRQLNLLPRVTETILADLDTGSGSQ